MDARGAIDRTFGHSKQARSLGKIHRVGRGRRKCVAILFASSLVVCAQNANGPSGHNDLATEEARALSTEDQTLSVRDANVILAFARTVLCHSETCCNKAYGPQGNAHCWDGVFKFDMCCNPKSEIHPYLRELYARRLSYHLRETTRDTQFGSAPLSRLGGGDWLLPQLPLHSQRDPRNCNAGTVVEDFSIVVMTRAAAFRAGIGRAWSILRTWARRMTEGTLAFAMEDDPVSVDATSLGVQLMYVKCPIYWPLDCNTYNAHMYTGPLGLRQMMQARPHSRWYVIADDDTYINPPALSQHLLRIDTSEPLCVGHKGSFSYLWYGAAFSCNNAAARILYAHLDACVQEASARWLVVVGDFLLGKCVHDLGIHMQELPGYFGGCLPLNHGVQGSFRTAASFHLVRRFADFDWLDAALFGDGHRFD